MSLSPERVEAARLVVVDMLTGRLTPESDPMLYEEDIVMFSVSIVEEADPEWLLAQLADTHYPLDGRLEVFNQMRDHVERALAILRREAPILNL